MGSCMGSRRRRGSMYWSLAAPPRFAARSKVTERMPYTFLPVAVPLPGVEMDTTKLTIRLPKQDVEFAKAYARAHGITVTEVIDRYLRRMRALSDAELSPDLDVITGLVPEHVDVEWEYRDHLVHKHG